LLQNLSFFNKLPIYFGSKLNTTKIHFSFYFRNIIKAVQEKQFTPDLEKVREKEIKTLYDFSKPYFFYNWNVINDKEIGGESTGQVFFNENHLYMKGSLVEERNDLLLQRMYYGIMSRYFTRLNLQEYNGIRLRIKTDGNLYKVLLNMTSAHENIHQAYAFIVDTSNEWQTLELPFASFLLEKNYIDDETQFLTQANLEKFLLRGIAILIENEKSKDFEMSLESIEVIYNPEFENLLSVYSRPFFFYAQESYKNAKEINLGKEKLQLDTDKFKERKKSVNDLFSEETPQPQQPPKQKKEPVQETKPALSIKERLAKKINK